MTTRVEVTIPWLPPHTLTAARVALAGALSSSLCAGLAYTSLFRLQPNAQIAWTLFAVASVASGPLARAVRPTALATNSWAPGFVAYVLPCAVFLFRAMHGGNWIAAAVAAVFAWVPHWFLAMPFLKVTETPAETDGALDAGLDPLARVACWSASFAGVALWCTSGSARGVVVTMLALWSAAAMALLVADAARVRWLSAVRAGRVPRWSLARADEVAGEELAPVLHGRDERPDGVLVIGASSGAGPYRTDEGRLPIARLPLGADNVAQRRVTRDALGWRTVRARGALLATAFSAAGALAFGSTDHEPPPDALAQHRMLTHEVSLRVPGVDLWRIHGGGWSRVVGVDERTGVALNAAQIAARASGMPELQRARLGLAMTNSALGEVVVQTDRRLSATEARRVRDPHLEDGALVFWVLRGASGSYPTSAQRLCRAHLSRRTGTAVLDPP